MDKSGNGNNATCNNTLIPNYKLGYGLINDLKTLNLAKTANSWIGGTTSVMPQTNILDVTTFVVARMENPTVDAASGTNPRLVSLWDGTSANDSDNVNSMVPLYFNNPDGTPRASLLWSGRGTGATSFFPTVPTTTSIFYSNLTNAFSGGATVGINGSTSSRIDYQYNSPITIGAYTIGAQRTGSITNPTITNAFNGTICEVLIFPCTFSNTERMVIEGYLATKWGLQSSLLSTHDYSYNKVVYQDTPPFTFVVNSILDNITSRESIVKFLNSSPLTPISVPNGTITTTLVPNTAIPITGAFAFGNLKMYIGQDSTLTRIVDSNGASKYYVGLPSAFSSNVPNYNAYANLTNNPIHYRTNFTPGISAIVTTTTTRAVPPFTAITHYRSNGANIGGRMYTGAVNSNTGDLYYNFIGFGGGLIFLAPFANNFNESIPIADYGDGAWGNPWIDGPKSGSQVTSRSWTDSSRGGSMNYIIESIEVSPTTTNLYFVYGNAVRTFVYQNKPWNYNASDRSNNPRWAYTPSTNPDIGIITTPGYSSGTPENTRLNEPRSVIFVSDSLMYILDSLNNSILIVFGSGKNANTSRITLVGCNNPKSMCYNALNNTLYIADSGNNRIVYITSPSANTNITPPVLVSGITNLNYMVSYDDKGVLFFLENFTSNTGGTLCFYQNGTKTTVTGAAEPDFISSGIKSIAIDKNRGILFCVVQEKFVHRYTIANLIPAPSMALLTTTRLMIRLFGGGGRNVNIVPLAKKSRVSKAKTPKKRKTQRKAKSKSARK